MKRVLAISLFLTALFMSPAAGAQTELPDDATLRSWVQKMEKSSTGALQAATLVLH